MFCSSCNRTLFLANGKKRYLFGSERVNIFEDPRLGAELLTEIGYFDIPTVKQIDWMPVSYRIFRHPNYEADRPEAGLLGYFGTPTEKQINTGADLL